MFRVSRISDSLIFNSNDDAYPVSVFGWKDKELARTGSGGTAFGIVSSGTPIIKTKDAEFRLSSGCYFSIVGSYEIRGGEGVLLDVPFFRGLNSCGGPIEDEGRLRYIDSCTDTLLISPPLLGDPCLNALFFPQNIDQTLHTHPSVRIGLVYDGFGFCRLADQEVPLRPGDVFVIEPETIHAFSTSKNAGMRIIAFHPDSDTGPDHQDHPMINRTIVGGISASEIPEIQTLRA